MSASRRSLPDARRRLPGGEAGVTAVEYALMAAVVIALFAVAATQLGGALTSRFDHDASCASVAYQGGGC